IASLSASLRPGREAGEAALAITIRPAETFDVYVGAANNRSPSVGDERVFTGGYARNALTSGDVISFEGGLTRGVTDAQLGYVAPLAPRTTLSLRGSLNNASVIDQPLLPLDISARDRSVEGAITQALLRRPLMPAELPYL